MNTLQNNKKIQWKHKVYQCGGTWERIGKHRESNKTLRITRNTMIFHGKLMRADLGEGSESIGKLLNIENQGKKRGKGRFINAGDSGKDRKA